MSDKYDLISIGAHPDDIEVGTGGVLIKMKKLGYRTGIIYLTRGEMGTGGTPELREKEAMAAAEVMGTDLLATLDFGDCKVADTYENRVRIAELIRRYRPEVVLAPYWQGGHGKKQSHPDHLATGRIVMNAAYYATFKKLPIRDEPHRVEGLYHYFLPPGTQPTFVVDISEEFEQWMEALKAHASQFLNPEKKRDYLFFLESRARTDGMMVGVKYGQGFLTGEPLNIADLFCLTRASSTGTPCPVRPCDPPETDKKS